MSDRPIFYPNYAILERQSPLGDKLDDCELVYAIWLTGTKSIRDVPQVKKVTRLLLPDPESKFLAYYQSAMGTDRHDLGNEIREATKLAQSNCIEVRWMNEFIGYTATIGNPEGRNTWIQIRLALPVIHGGKHPSFELRRPKHDETIDDILKMFDEFWRNKKLSHKPNLGKWNSGTRKISKP